MRVGLFHTTLPEPGRKVGGVELFVHRLAGQLAGRGHKVTMFTVAGRAPDGARYALRHIGRPATDSRLGRLTLTPLALNRVDWSGLDVLSLHGDDWFFVRRPLPTVRSFHGSALYEARTATSMPRAISQRLAYAGELLASRLADRAYTSAAQMPSAYRLHGRLALAADPPAQPPGDAQPRSAHPSLLFVGTWEGRKRGRFLRDLFVREVLPAIPQAELWMVSDRCEESASVRWMRHPADAELSALYRRAWLCCLPSTYEGFGLPYLEAMLHGTAVIASPNSGAQWVTDGGRAGVLASDGELGAQIVRLLGDEDLRARYAAAGLERADAFSWERTCAEHERAFADAIAAFGASHPRSAA